MGSLSRAKPPQSVIVTLAVFVGFAFMANDIVVLELQPMKYLGIVVPESHGHLAVVSLMKTAKGEFCLEA